MANRRKSKTVLGQTTPIEESKEVKVTVAKEDVDAIKELHDLDLVKEAKEMAAEETGVNVEDVIVEIVEEPEAPEQPLEEVVTDEVVATPKVRKVGDLNAQEYRYYMNTGIIPQ